MNIDKFPETTTLSDGDQFSVYPDPSNGGITRGKVLASSVRAYTAPSILDFPANGSDYTSAIQSAIDNYAEVFVPDGEYGFTSLDFPSSVTFSGPGTLVGLSTSGSAPTRADLTATNEAGRLVELQNHYGASISCASGASNVYGTLRLKDALIVGVGGGTSFHNEFIGDNVSAHDQEIIARRGGTITISNYCAFSDSGSTGLFTDGGIIVAQAAIIVAPTTRGVMCYRGGLIDIANGEIWSAGSEGAYILQGGTIIATNATIDSSAEDGALINYAGSMDLQSATINNNGAAGIVSESNGTIYAELAQVTNNGTVGIFTVYGGMIQASSATVTGNGTYGAYANGAGYIDLSSATVDNTNTGAAGQILRAIGMGQIAAGAPGSGGFSTLSASHYYPGYNVVGNGNAIVGGWGNDTHIHSLYAIKGPTSPPNAVISSGVATPTSSWATVDTESAASTDDLDDIDPTNTHIWHVRTASSSRDVTLKHNATATNPILLNTGADKTLASINEVITLIYNPASGFWIEPE